MNTYGQFCPVAKAMELLDERWTLLIIRELLLGSRHFNDLRRGVPRMSPTLLSKRLRTLTRVGVVERVEDGNRVTYDLTPAGRELLPIVERIGQWGTRWIHDLGDEDLDPHLLLWDIHRNLDHDALPDRRTVLHFVFRDVASPADRWWLVVTPEEVDVCNVDPGHPVTVTVTSDLRALTQVWRGDLTWNDAVRAGGVALDGPPAARRALPHWLRLSMFAPVPRATPPLLVGGAPTA